MRTNREIHPEHRHFMRRNSKNGIVPIILAVLSVILLLVCYTWILQYNFSRNTLETAVERNTLRMETIYESMIGVLEDDDFRAINAREDMGTELYLSMQNELNQMRKLKTVR